MNSLRACRSCSDQNFFRHHWRIAKKTIRYTTQQIMKKSLLTLFALAAGALLTRADILVIKGSDTLGAKLVP